jgi:putative ABC transport system permease protein
MKSNKFSSVPPSVLLYIAWQNLVSKKLRAFLTLFGIVIGIGAIFFLLSFGLGLQKLVTKEVVGNESIKAVDITTPNNRVVSLNQKNYSIIKNLPHVVNIGATYSFAGHIESSGSEVDTIVYGVDQNYALMDHPTILAGRLIRSGDDRTVTINQSVIKSIGLKSAKAAIGKKLLFRIPLGTVGDGSTIHREFTVVGVIQGEGGNEVSIPQTVFLAHKLDQFTQLKVEIDDTSNIAVFRSQVQTLGLETASPVDTVDQINQVFKFFNVIMVGFGAIGMIVAVLGMFNTLTISLLERTREIGLMIALGGRNRDMRRLFVFEAVLLSVIGAVIGIVGAIIIGQIINLVMNAFAHGRGVTESFQLFSTPWWLVLGMIGFMLLVGLLVVFLPARRAAHINPIDALRRD